MIFPYDRANDACVPSRRIEERRRSSAELLDPELGADPPAVGCSETSRSTLSGEPIRGDSLGGEWGGVIRGA